MTSTATSMASHSASRFLKPLRPEEKFDNVEKLQHQVQRDIQNARDYLKENDEDQARAG